LPDNALRMLVAVDLDQSGEAVLTEAARYASRMNAVLDLLHVAPPEPSDFVGYAAGPQSVRDSVARHLRETHSAVMGLRNKIEQSGVTVGHALTIQGEVFNAIAEEVRRLKPDLLVMGQSHHHGFFQYLGRSSTQKAVEEIKCVMMIVPTR
jgi:nucleotide-binding universal stress UspA family protein